MNTKRSTGIRKANLLLKKAVKYYQHSVKYRPLDSVNVLKLKIIILSQEFISTGKIKYYTA